MKIKSVCVVLWMYYIGMHGLYAQKSLKKLGDIYFEAGNYLMALDAYNRYDKTKLEPGTLVKRGKSNYYCNHPDACINDMALAHNLKSIDNQRFKYTAMALFAKKEYVEASKFYKIYLNSLKKNSIEWQNIIRNILNCGNAKNFQFLPQMGFVENLGPNVNSFYHDFAPVQSPTKQGRYYFSSAREGTIGGRRDKKGFADDIRGHYSSDMFMVDLNDGNWSAVLPFEPLLSSPKHDILQDFSIDGSVIFYLKSADGITGFLYSDTFNLDRDPSKLPQKINLPFKPEMGDSDLFVFNDSIILFSSVRPEGFGGKDIYCALKTNGMWSSAVNLGPDVNTVDNEISPFLLKSGTTLFYSSDRLESLGGYDIFMSKFRVEKGWKDAVNMGSPINSPGNDIDIEISADGKSAVFASDRVESYGGLDLFIVYFNNQLIEQLEFSDLPPFLMIDTIKSITKDTLITTNVVEEFKNLPIRDFVNKPLYFSDSEDVINQNNLLKIRKLSELMTIFPDVSVLLLSHYIPESQVETELYFSVKRAEKVAEQLMANGIRPQRILIQGCGSNFPLAVPFINGISSNLADKTNKRIDVVIYFNPATPLKITEDLPTVNAIYRDTLWDRFSEKNKGVTFRVRFAKVSQMLKSDVMALRKDIIVEKRMGEDKYIYTMGNFTNFSEALSLKNHLLQNYISFPEIIPYFNNMQMSADAIKEKQKEFPELGHFVSEIQK